MAVPAETGRRVSFASSKERVLVVHITFGSEVLSPGAEAEMRALVASAGAEVAASVTAHRRAPDSSTFVGSGKVEEIRSAAEAGGITTLIFDHNLGPGQVTRLEKVTGCKVIDRTELIMTIFALHARTAESKLQIELAMLRYALPRLSGMWHHLSRLGGGIGTRGPGETQLEVDRRRARKRIDILQEQIDRIEARRVLRSGKRSGMFKVVLTGYTNTGKSTLLNRLCGSGVLTEDRLFATLDSTSRRLDPGGGGAVVVSDTVGFIERLPENLVASFRSTLAVVREADLVVLVGDLSDPWREGQMTAVRSTLDSIGAGDIPRILVWNKRDMVPDAPAPMDGLAVSALTGEGITALVERIRQARDRSLEWFDLTLPPESGPEENWIRENCSIRSRRSGRDGIRIVAGCARGVDLIRSYLAERPEGWTITPLEQPPEDASPESGRDG